MLTAIAAVILSGQNAAPPSRLTNCLHGVEQLIIVTTVDGNAAASDSTTIEAVAKLAIQEAKITIKSMNDLVHGDKLPATPRTATNRPAAFFYVSVTRLSADQGLHSAMHVTEEVYTIASLNGGLAKEVLWSSGNLVSISGHTGEAQVEEDAVESMSKQLVSDYLTVNPAPR